MSRRVLSFLTVICLAVGGLGLVSAPAGASNLSTGVWLEIGSLTSSSFDTKLVPLNAGTRALALGANGRSDVYDLACNCWTPVNPLWGAAPLVGLADGRAFAAGGWAAGAGTPSARAAVFNPATNTWADVAPMPFGLGAHVMALLADGRVLVAGGTTGGTTPPPASLLYDPSSNSWTTVGAQPAFLLAVLWDGRALAVRHTDAALFDPVSGAWQSVAGPAQLHGGATLDVLADGRVLLAGGISGQGEVPELFDPATGSWSPTGPLHRVRWMHASSVLPDGRVLIAGGSTSTGTLLTGSELFDPATGAWTPTAPLNAPRNSFDAVTMERGNVLAAGGGRQPSEFFGFSDFGRPQVLEAVVDPSTKRADQTAALSALVRSGPEVARVEYALSDAGPWTTLSLSDWYGYIRAAGVIGTDLAPGQYQVRVRALDSLGRASTTRSADLTVEPVDTTGPTMANTVVNPSYKRVDQQAVVTARSYGEDAVAAEFFVDAGTATPMAKTFDNVWEKGWEAVLGTGVPVGSHSLSTRVRDRAGNWSAPDMVPFEVWADTEGPVLSHTSLQPGDRQADQTSWLMTETNISDAAAAEFFVGADPGQGAGERLQLSYDNGIFKQWSGTVGLLPEGQYTVSVRAMDSLGNWGPVASLPLHVRPVTGPVLVSAFVSPNPKLSHEAAWVVAETPGTDAAAVEYYVDADPGVGRGAALQYQWGTSSYAQWAGQMGTDVATGEHTVFVRAMSGAGAWGEVTAVPLTVVLDTTGPTLEQAQATPNPKRDDEDGWVFSRVAQGNDELAGGEYFVDADPGAGAGLPLQVADYGAYGSPKELYAKLAAGIAPGRHMVGMRAVDVRGNWGPVTSVELVVVGDTVAPTLQSAGAWPNPKHVDQTGWVGAAFSDDRAVVRGEVFEGADPGIGGGTPADAYFDGVYWSVAQFVDSRLPVGDHVFGIRAVDAAGNWSATGFVTMTVYGDVTPPVVGGVFVTPTPVWSHLPATVSATAYDQESGVTRVELFLDVDPGAGNGLPMTVAWPSQRTLGPGLSPGEHVVGVRAMDGRGNWSEPVLATFLVRADVAAPAVSSVSVSPTPKAVGEPASLSVAASDDVAVAGGEWRVDGGPAAALDGALGASIPAGSVPVGEHVVSVRVIDAVGKWSAWASAPLAVFDPLAGRLTGGGTLDKSASSDGGRSSFKIEGGYDGAGDRVADGRLDIATSTVSVSATSFGFLAVGGGAFSGVAQATSKSGEVWTVRFRGTTGPGSSVSFELYRAGQAAPAVSVSGKPNQGFTVHK